MDSMIIWRFLGIPSLVRRIISVITGLIIAVMPSFLFFTTKDKAAEYMLVGDEVFSSEASDSWTVGFAKEVLTPDDVTADTYYIAGYWSNNPAQGVLDDMFARAVYLDDNTGRGGVVMCAIDCVGISRADINDIRKLVIESKAIPDLKSINICSTHAHSAIDTQGLWGKEFYTDGKNDAFMQRLKEKTADAIIASYKARESGKLYIGTADAEGMQTDVRTPVDYSSTLTRIRFSPDGEGKDTYIINYACHAELLGKYSNMISADFPAYMGKEIERQTDGANFMFINGAIGGMVSAAEIDEVYNNDDFDCTAYTMEYGKEIGEIVMSVSNETEIAPLVNIKTQPVSVKCDNTMLVLARFLGVLNNDIEKGAKRTEAYILSEVSYMELGDEQIGIFLIPGELYPELESGNFLAADESANGFEADYKVLSEMTDCEYSFVAGLCNDELGYIIPDNDFMLHEWLPYFNIPHDSFEREHYEETNSVGIDTARVILGAVDELIASAKG